MPDYKLKSELLNSGIVSEVNAIKFSLWAESALLCDGQLVRSKYSGEEAAKRYSELLRTNYVEVQECERILHAQFQRSCRLKSRVQYMLNSFECVFVTLTFTDEYLASTSEDTRKQYVRKYLKSQSGGLPYIANIDFGAKNHREHYHALCAFRLDPKAWSCGALNVKKVRNTSKPLVLAKYISKLTNHAIKETAKRSAIIYSR